MAAKTAEQLGDAEAYAGRTAGDQRDLTGEQVWSKGRGLLHDGRS
jgi:hypothetical protein